MAGYAFPTDLAASSSYKGNEDAPLDRKKPGGY